MSSSETNRPNDRSKIEQGQKFEKLAVQFYLDDGYKLLEQNWRAGHKEIDLIVQKDNLIIFVEVKSTYSNKFGHPIERIDKRKIQNLTACAQQYIIAKELRDVDLRFDVVTFTHGQLEHFPNAFEAE